MSNNSRLVEIVFKGERKAIYRNRGELDINVDDYVIVEAERGLEMGRVTLMGELVRLKRGKGETRGVIRKSTDKDLETSGKNKEKEKEAFKACHERIGRYGLDMKLVDVEMQHDGSKITFFFTAAQRVDFRELVKELAAVYRTRIELRQIGVRDEAKRISGVGICGQPQCCGAFLSEFEQITTQMAKDQQLSLNPAKISGNCGRLLCCLRYEEAMYQDVFKQFPQLHSGVVIDGKKGLLNYINVFTCKGLVHFEEGPDLWLTAEEIQKGKAINVEQQQEP
jgi:cell fate regulator YaaT (PSP1 superfamily)